MPLVIVPTPVGNLEDITLRALRELRLADVIACEDTRRTLKLLNRYGIKKPLLSYHRHNERSRAAELLSRMERGERVALVSDAGTPGISDPGYALIEAAGSNGILVDALPGANAILPALLLSGIRPYPFMFVGFPEAGGPKGAKKLGRLVGLDATLVFFAAPHDLPRELATLSSCLGDRDAAIVREISKIHQEVIRGSLRDLADTAVSREIKGEIVIVVAGGGETEEETPDWRAEATGLKARGIFDKEIANALFERYCIPRNEVKAFLIETSEVTDDE
ncbi:MAG: 16S rRNA (cytidine(1402)-2'-O)-methyltransferase [Synergistaceae bacterium]|jgi:16S rRNA (cytidine1402-2'-O)-methyltransferase|nr:16S rRNA (cytidine(1402)-2'-O)-methyltransferase [Synergistaceae bacterium]